MNNMPSNPDNLPCYDPSIGYYCPGGGSQNIDEFGAYLHNPWGFPTQQQKIEIKKFTYYSSDPKKYIYDFLLKYFGNKHKLVREGLVIQYKKLQENVEKNGIIGMILWGADINNVNLSLIDYTTHEGKNISLTVSTICQFLLKEYIKDY